MRFRATAVMAVVALLTLAACVTGTAIVTGNTRDPVAPEQVKLYHDPPAAFETLGLVSAESSPAWTQQETLEYAIKELKKQAAKLGANGVLLASSDYAVHLTGRSVKGTAIFVKAQ